MTAHRNPPKTFDRQGTRPTIKVYQESDQCLQGSKSESLVLELWNVLDNHQTRSYDQAVAVLEDLLTKEGNEQMNAYFKFPSGW